MSSLSRILPFRNPNLWKGVGLGVAVCVLLLIGVGSNLFYLPMAKRMARSSDLRMSSYAGEGGAFLKAANYSHLVEADGPKIVRKAQLDMVVSNCTEIQKKIEALATAEAGFVESSALQENSAKITLRVPSARLDAVRAKLRELATRVRQDGINASDVSKQYFDREARLRNLRAEEQQFLEVMRKAHTVADILEVTKSLSETRGEIEEAEAEFRHLKDEIDMAQIEVNLSSPSSASETHWSASSSVKSAANDLMDSLTSFGDFLIWLVVNIPIIVLWIAAVFLLLAASWYVLRKAIRLMRALFGSKPGTSPGRQ